MVVPDLQPSRSCLRESKPSFVLRILTLEASHESSWKRQSEFAGIRGHCRKNLRVAHHGREQDRRQPQLLILQPDEALTQSAFASSTYSSPLLSLAHAVL